MHIKILGSAGDGGFPQWNCRCPNCSGLRSGQLRGKARRQTQITFSPMTDVWFLFGASPDLRSQILTMPGLSPRGEGSGQSPIAGVFLSSAEVDAAMGLLHLREFQNFFVFATPAVQRILKNENRMFKELERSDPPVHWQALAERRRVGCHLSENPDDAPTFFYTAVPLGGDFPDYASEEIRRSGPSDEANVGFLIEQGSKKFFFAPKISGHHSAWSKIVASADVALIDGTFWSDDELLATGRTKKTARELGHLPLSGADGLLAQFPPQARGRKILIHMNNTNPILDESSAEHRAAAEAGFEIAYDGMEIEL